MICTFLSVSAAIFLMYHSDWHVCLKDIKQAVPLGFITTPLDLYLTS